MASRVHLPVLLALLHCCVAQPVLPPLPFLHEAVAAHMLEPAPFVAPRLPASPLAAPPPAPLELPTPPRLPWEHGAGPTDFMGRPEGADEDARNKVLRGAVDEMSAMGPEEQARVWALLGPAQQGELLQYVARQSRHNVARANDAMLGLAERVAAAPSTALPNPSETARTVAQLQPIADPALADRWGLLTEVQRKEALEALSPARRHDLFLALKNAGNIPPHILVPSMS